MLILKHLKGLQHVSIIIQIIFREFVSSLLKSLNLKFKILLHTERYALTPSVMLPHTTFDFLHVYPSPKSSIKMKTRIGICGIMLTGEKVGVLGEKLSQCHFVQHEPVQDRIRVSAVRGRRPTL